MDSAFTRDEPGALADFMARFQQGAPRLPITMLTDGRLSLVRGQPALPEGFQDCLRTGEGVLSSPIRANHERLLAIASNSVSMPLGVAVPFRLATANENENVYASVEKIEYQSMDYVLLFAFVHQRIRRLPVPERLTVWLGLSPTEASLACELAAGFDVGEIAARRSLSELTVRTHLRTIFEKTKTHKQRDLVALLVLLGSI